MTLSTKGLDWLARNAGSGNCFTTSGVTYKDADGNNHTGGTGDVVNAFFTAASTHDATNNNRNHVIIADTTYNMFVASGINNAELVMSDANEAWDREEAGGTYPLYCYTEDTGCTVGVRRCRTGSVIEECIAGTPNYWRDVQTCGAGFTCQGGDCVEEAARPVTGPLQVYVGGGESCDPAVEGDPSVTLDTSEAFAYFKAEPITYVGVMDILVQNLSDRCFAYFAWEMSMWDGVAGDSCPITIPERKQITRYLGEVSDKKIISVTRTNASENKMIGGSFEIPATLEGMKTICLSLWGSFNKQALLDELVVAGYAEEIPW